MFYALFSIAFALDTGDKAPNFSLTSLEGQDFSLYAYTGKVVVLEWFNPDCPYVKYAYNNTDLPKMQHQYISYQSYSKEKTKTKNTVDASMNKVDIVWLSINSGYPKKQGTDVTRNQNAKDEWKIKHPILLDPTGEVGRMYNAQTTPQFVVIDVDGNIQYQGALDNSPMGKRKGNRQNLGRGNNEKEKTETTNGQQNYLFDALQQLSTGQLPNIHKSKPYGCSVKYK